MQRFVFIGPTLRPEERPALPLEYRPPVRHGDLFRLNLQPGDAVLVVDGVYQHYAPLRHKEIMAALANGVRCYGAASFGALRAAELHELGMTGIGRVADGYRSGTLSADADVAVLQSDDERNLRLSIALVSVRYAVDDLVSAGRLEPGAGERLVGAARSLHFTERFPVLLRERAEAIGLRDEMSFLLAELRRNGDVKQHDARCAIEEIAAYQYERGTRQPAPRWENSYALEWSLGATPAVPGGAVSRRQVLAYLQISASDYPARHRAYVHRVVASTVGAGGEAAALLNAGGLSAAAVAAGRFAAATAATAAWSPEDRALVRTFRLPPGRCVYNAVPPEALQGEALGAVAASCERWLAGPDSGWPADAEWHGVLRERWSAATAQEYELCAMERGFRGPSDAVRVARDFDIARVRAR